MTEKELKRLNRKELLELLLVQTKRADDLEIKLAEMEKKLQDRAIIEKEAGSIAEAALKLNGIFEAADKAALQYLENIKRLGQQMQEPSPEPIWESSNQCCEEEEPIETERESECITNNSTTNNPFRLRRHCKRK